jgi:hypothetical protein
LLKFSAETRGPLKKPVLGIGLSRANCEKLLNGRPILFSTKGMDELPELEIFIMAGETEEAMALDLMNLGALRLDQIREDPSLADPHGSVRPADDKSN